MGLLPRLSVIIYAHVALYYLNSGGMSTTTVGDVKLLPLILSSSGILLVMLAFLHRKVHVILDPGNAPLPVVCMTLAPSTTLRHFYAAPAGTGR